MTDRMSQKWFVKLRAGDCSLGEAPQSSRPVAVDSDQMETLTENNQCSTRWDTASIPKISKSIKFSVKMKTVSFILWKKPYGRFGQPNKTGPWAPSELGTKGSRK